MSVNWERKYLGLAPFEFDEGTRWYASFITLNNGCFLALSNNFGDVCLEHTQEGRDTACSVCLSSSHFLKFADKYEIGGWYTLEFENEEFSQVAPSGSTFILSEQGHWRSVINQEFRIFYALPRHVLKFDPPTPPELVEPEYEITNNMSKTEIDTEPLIVSSIAAFLGYIVFHGHRLNQDCWLCQYRGLAMVGGALSFGGYAAMNS